MAGPGPLRCGPAAETRGGRVGGRGAQRGLAAGSLPFQECDDLISASVLSFMNMWVMAPPPWPAVGIQRRWAHVPSGATLPWLACRECRRLPSWPRGVGRSQSGCSLQSREMSLVARKVFGDIGIMSQAAVQSNQTGLASSDWSTLKP